MVTGISRVSVLAEASLASYPAITAELEAAHAAASAAMRREFERQQLAAVMATGECPETVTLYKSRSCGKSEASAWQGIFGLPEPTAPRPPHRDPRGNRAQRRRLEALARRR